MNDRIWVTYRRADGELIDGQYGFVADPEYFDDVHEPVKVIKETWILQEEEPVVFEPHGWCEDEWEEWYEDDEEPWKPVNQVTK